MGMGPGPGPGPGPGARVATGARVPHVRRPCNLVTHYTWNFIFIEPIAIMLAKFILEEC